MKIRGLALCLALAAGLCLAGATPVAVAPDADADPQPWQIEDDDAPSSSRKLQSLQEGQKWSPGYISSTLAEAWADVMRITAEAKANKTKMLSPEVMPQPIPLPLPGKSKNFSFTSIKLSTSATFPSGGGILSPSPGPAPSPPPIIDSVGTAAGAPPPTSPFVTTPTPGGANPFVTTTTAAPSGARAAEVSGARPTEMAPSGARSGSAVTAQAQKQTPEDLQAKLAALQAQLVELEAMKQQLRLSPPPPAGRRLLDSGEPGWDAGALLEKMIDLVTMQAELVQQRLENRAGAVGDSFSGLLASAGVFQDAAAGILGAGENRLGELANILRQRGQARAGNLQDTLGWLMEARAARRRAQLHG